MVSLLLARPTALQFAEMDNFRFELNPSGTDLSRCNAVLNGVVRARRYTVSDFETTLSVKSVTRGCASYRTREGRFRVEADTFLILNEGQQYSLEIEAGSDTETVCPFFQPGFLRHVAHSLDCEPARQLDDPAADGPEQGFFERLYPKANCRAAARLAELASGLRSLAASRPWLEDRLYSFAGDLLTLRTGVRREVEAFPGSRLSTREEMYRRLHRARDYIDSCFADKLSVESVARIACLSPYHFHRTFRLAFGETPMRHLQERRLRAACRLLAATDRSVTEICLEVGFDSLGTFSWLFRRRFGESPREFRSRRPVR
jgi:AraC-like DNA-binding protein